jgi:hypothetical protein
LAARSLPRVTTSVLGGLALAAFLFIRRATAASAARPPDISVEAENASAAAKSESGSGSTEAPERQGLVAFLFANYTVIVSLVGVVVYGVVRVSHDAFYARLGVSPEAVGITEATILGRAALYLVLALSAAAAFAGAWVAFMRWQLRTYLADRERDHILLGRTVSSRLYLVVVAATAIMVVSFFFAVRQGLPALTDAVMSKRIAHVCFNYCDIKPYSREQLADIRALALENLKKDELVERGEKAGIADASKLDKPELVDRLAQEVPRLRVIDIAPTWILVVLLGATLPALAASVVLDRANAFRRRERVLAAIAIAFVAGFSLAAGLLAPHFIKLVQAANVDGLQWAVLFLLMLSVALCCLPVLRALVSSEPASRKGEPGEHVAFPSRAFPNSVRERLCSRWIVLSFFVALPLLLGFFAPNVVVFLQAEGIRTLLAAIGLWLVLAPTAFFALTWLAYSEQPKAERPRPPLRLLLPLLAAVATLALVVAWARGTNLAKFAADGNQITGKRFGLLSVRANVVCLDPVETSMESGLKRGPYLFLGQAGGSLVLYDYLTDRTSLQPQAFPMRAPAASTIVRIADYDQSASPRWSCGPAS